MKQIKPILNFKDVNVINSYRFVGIDFSDAFIMDVSMSASEQFVIPANGSNNIEVIDWGDGSFDYNVISVNPSHTYTNAGTYQIRIKGIMPDFGFNNTGNKLNVLSVKVGNNGLSTVDGFLYGCLNCTSVDLSGDWSNFTGTHALMFASCGFTSIDLSPLSVTSSNNYSSFLLNYLGSSIDITPLNYNANTTMAQFLQGSKLTSFSFAGVDTSNWISVASFLANVTTNTSINFTGVDSSGWTNANRFMQSNWGVTSIDLSGLDFSNITNLGNFANGCINLTTMNAGGLTVSSCTNFDLFANNCPISTTEYDSILNVNSGWYSRGMQTVSGNNFNFSLAKYTAGGDAEAGRTAIAALGWTIVDSGAA